MAINIFSYIKSVTSKKEREVFASLEDWDVSRKWLQEYSGLHNLNLADEQGDHLHILATELAKFSILNTKVFLFIREIISSGEEGDNLKDLKEVKWVLLYISNLILSRQRYFLMSEEAKKPINKSNFSYDSNIYDDYYDLIRTLSKIKKNKKINDISYLKSLTISTLMKAVLSHELVFDSETSEAIFLKYDIKKSDAEVTIKKMISEIITYDSFNTNNQSKDNQNKYRKNLREGLYTASLIPYQQTTCGNNDYKEGYLKAKEGGAFDPFVMLFCSIIWKSRTLVKSAPIESLSKDQRVSLQSNHAEKLQLVGETIKVLTETQTEETYKNVFNSISILVSTVVELKDATEKNAFYQRVSLEDHKKFIKEITAPATPATKINILNPCLKDLNKDFPNRVDKKIDYLLQKLDIEKFNYLILEYKNKFETITNGLDNLQMIGHSASGVFLGHLINIFTKNESRTIYMFRIYPHVSLLPFFFYEKNDKENQNSKTINFISLDESSKSQISNRILIDEISRKYGVELNKIKALSLVDYKDIEHILNDFNTDKKYTKIDSSSILPVENHAFYGREFDELLGTTFEISVKNLEVTKQQIDKITKEDFKGDFSFIFLYTPLYVYCSKTILDELDNLDKLNQIVKKNYKFIADCDFGKALMFMAYWLFKNKIHGNPKLKIEIHNKSDTPDEDTYTYFLIDISEHSGYSLESAKKAFKIVDLAVLTPIFEEKGPA